MLLDEAVDALAIEGARADGIYMDGTFGRGGHSRLILERLGARGRLIAFDKDPQAIAAAQHDQPIARFDDRARQLCDDGDGAGGARRRAGRWHFAGSWAFPRRRWTTRRGASVSGWTVRSTCGWTRRAACRRPSGWRRQAEQTIEKVIRDYGEERFAFQIAKAIVARRAVEPISSTRQLAEIVAHAVKTREKGKDPATRTFQAIRIFINQELEELEVGLDSAFGMLGSAGAAGRDQLSFAGRPHRQAVHGVQGQCAAAGPPPADPRRRPAAAGDEAAGARSSRPPPKSPPIRAPARPSCGSPNAQPSRWGT